MSISRAKGLTVYRAVTIFRMIERKRKPADTKDARVCMCMGRSKEHHNVHWEDIFWLDDRSKKKRWSQAWLSLCLFYSWSCRNLLLMALLIMWELNVSLDISFTHTHSFLKATNQATSGCNFSPPTPSNHMTPHCQIPHTPNPDIYVSTSSIFTLKIQIVIPWCSDIQHMKWVNPESQT